MKGRWRKVFIDGKWKDMWVEDTKAASSGVSYVVSNTGTGEKQVLGPDGRPIKTLRRPVGFGR